MTVVSLLGVFGCVLVLFSGTDAKVIQMRHRDCHGIWREMIQNNQAPEAGDFLIYPNNSHPISVYCNHSRDATATVLQRRMYGTETFYRGWQDYKHGFGHAQGDYWIGLDTMHHLTSIGGSYLRIDMQDWKGNNRYAIYTHFSVASETYGYQLSIGGFSGNVPDDMSFQHNMYFYTYDRPDINYCASHQKAGWWYNYCAYALLNGIYYRGGPYNPSGGYYDGIYWKDWYGYGYSLKFVSMSLIKH